jgi:hypothetical protein
LVTGSSWLDIEAIMNFEVPDTTLRTRRDEWIAAGLFDQRETEARHGYDLTIELDLGVVAIDGSLRKAPCGGEGNRQEPCRPGQTRLEVVGRGRHSRDPAGLGDRCRQPQRHPTLGAHPRRRRRVRFAR